MDSQTFPDQDFSSRRSSDPAKDPPGSASYGGAIFSCSQNFTVNGGTFTSITKNYPTVSTVASDLRIIPLCDLDLQREIRLLDRVAVAHPHPERRSVRRLYSAKIEGRRSSVTVAMYQGNEAEEELRQDIANYTAVRHPNIIQICGTVSFGNIHATIFHDELIPLEEFVALYRESHFSAVYIHASSYAEFKSATEYMDCTLKHRVEERDCTLFIRRSTGRLCVDLRQGPWVFASLGSVTIYQLPGPEWLGTPDVDATVFCSLTLTQYHTICYREFSHREYFSISISATVNLGAVIFRPVGTEVADLVASLPDVEVEVDKSGWTMENMAGSSPGLEGDLMEDGWTRFGDAVDTTISLWVGRRPPFAYWFSQAWLSEAWLSQANHTFNRLGISSNVERYGIVASIGFKVTLSATTAVPPKGYLFLCPRIHFSIGPSSSKWPDCPAYWSLDPSGAKRLSMEDAAQRGFPSVRLTTDIASRSWDARTYQGLRQFHQAKGFDPYSPYVARHLGYDLYQLSSEIDVPFSLEAADANSGSEEYPNNESGCAQTSASNDYGQCNSTEAKETLIITDCRRGLPVGGRKA
ncbi:hypothetical protein C8J57DRAFT_351382 [Mycena rebaudengoi]|nr:hypothetical protein C8J57DRAFT_351382 [Mycena rebaudengoi]